MLFVSPRGLLRRRRKWTDLLILSLAFVLLLDTYPLIFVDPPQRVSPSIFRLQRNERIFIASMHWNNEAILRSNWSQAVLDLVKYLGADNIFVAVLESGGWDSSKAALQELDAELQQMSVPRSFIFDDVTHKNATERTPAIGEEGWIWTPRGRKELRRIPYLAKLRNRVMEEMRTALSADARPFTKVLWLNDVVFTVWALAYRTPIPLMERKKRFILIMLLRNTDLRRPHPPLHQRRRLRCSVQSRFRQAASLLRHICAEGRHGPQDTYADMAVLCLIGNAQRSRVQLWYSTRAVVLERDGSDGCSALHRRRAATQIQRYPGPARRAASRGLRVLPRPRRQSPQRLEGGLAERKRAHGIRSCCLRHCQLCTTPSMAFADGTNHGHVA